MSALVVIPARMGARRFPGKPLVDLLGKPMVQWVYEAAMEAAIGRVVVATPDPEIVDACASFGADTVLTRHDHLTGTDRIAEVAEKVEADFYVNVQGDEPLMPVESIRACAQPMLQDASVQMASVWTPCPDDELNNPMVVKVVTAANGDALYFSRHAIPFDRNPRVIAIKKHLGLYAYRRTALAAFATWEQSPLEIPESLEQLRFLHNGIAIRMVEGAPTGLAIDTPEQADQVRAILAARVG